MTHGDRARFGELLYGFAEMFDEAVSPMRAELYFNALAHLSIDQVSAALTEAARTMKFFPKPVELLKLADAEPTNDAELAWLTVVRQVRRVGSHGTPEFGDPYIAPSIESTFGSWTRLCERLPEDGPLALRLAEMFKTIYAAYRKRDDDGRLLDGQTRFKGLLS